MPGVRRFRDQGDRWDSFIDEEILVRCPRCDRPASVVRRPGADTPDAPGRGPRVPVAHRLACRACGLIRDAGPGTPVRRHDDARDPFFGVPLWLSARCAGGHLLWAYGVRHLELLEAYVGAHLRERRLTPGSASMATRLPRWMTAAGNRAEVLRALARLRATIPAP